jgi:peptidoglycan hydrolase CwlO-like protein
MLLSKAIGNVRLYTILILLATITFSSCISPSSVRHGNKKDYLLPSDIKQNTDTDVDFAESEKFDQNSEASSSALNPDQFNKDLKKVLENNKSSNGEEEVIDSELVIPELTQDDADELSKLTQELFDRKPEKNNEKLQTQASAVTGLPTLQNQIDAMKGTYLEYDTKLDNLTENITRANGRLQVVESDISMLKKKVDE